jgi:hypothetical protein
VWNWDRFFVALFTAILLCFAHCDYLSRFRFCLHHFSFLWVYKEYHLELSYISITKAKCCGVLICKRHISQVQICRTLNRSDTRLNVPDWILILVLFLSVVLINTYFCLLHLISAPLIHYVVILLNRIISWFLNRSNIFNMMWHACKFSWIWFLFNIMKIFKGYVEC